VILAVDGHSAAAILGEPERAPEWSGCVTLYFGAPTAPFDDPLLMLNGNGPDDGPVNHVCVPSAVVPEYAPPGRALVSATVVGAPQQDAETLEHRVRTQLETWYGLDVRAWTHIRTYHLPRSLPRLRHPPAAQRPQSIGASTVWIAGDHTDTPSINGAMRSGRLAAEAVLEHRAQGG
jgi:phytoene dehydrogenase-like protein